MLTYADVCRGKEADELHVCLMSATMDSTLLRDYFSSSIGSSFGPVPRVSGIQFTCVTGTKVQILTLTGTIVQILTLQCHSCQVAASIFVLLY